MTQKEIETLYDYDRWANARTMEIVSSLNDGQFKRDLSSSYGGIHGTLVHIYSADWVWLERWKGASPAMSITVTEVPTLADLVEKWTHVQEDTRRFVATLTDQKLQSRFAYKDVRGNSHEEPLAHQMQHKVNHSSYHRGQVVTMLRQLGVKPQSTDLINYYRQLEKNG